MFWLPSVFSETPLNCSVYHTTYIINNCYPFEGAGINSALRVALPRHNMSLKLRLRFESSRVWKILMLISDWELGNRDELPLVMASGQRSATCSTAQPWAIKPDWKERLKSAANQTPRGRLMAFIQSFYWQISHSSFLPQQPEKVMMLRYKTTLKKTKKTTKRLKQPKYWRLMGCNDGVLSFHLDDCAATSAVPQEKLVKAQRFLPVVALGTNIYMHGIWRRCDETFPCWVSAYLSPILSKTFSSVSLLCWPHSSLHY